MTINEKLSQLRELMRRERLAAFIFPSTDPHNGEYIPDHWKGREWISGFNGSAGTAVVTLNSAALWTDSRYFLAAADQLQGTEFQLMKLKMPGTPTIPQWLGQELRNAEFTEIGIDGMTSSLRSVEDLIKEMRTQGGITVRTNFDPLDSIWTNRPSIPENSIELHPLQYAGEDCQSKINRIRQALRQYRADGMLVSALDDIAWTLNLRGSDVHCNPVFVAYLLIASNKVTLFVNPKKITPQVSAYLQQNNIDVDDYQNVRKGLQDYFEYNILIDPNETSYTLAKATNKNEVLLQKSPIPSIKCIKNETEIAGFKQAMIKDGIALVKFLRWLRPAVEAGGQTECSLDQKLTALRAEQPLFRGVSFDTIVGYEAHGAIVHYEPTPETDIPVEPRGFVLIDSGAQFLDGTTDVTRTIALGPVTDFQRHVYTLVLKGHIALARCKFPDGAAGTQMDILAREAMWREGYNYLHGTGHGVGQYLNVHEGPHQFRMEWMPAPFHAGMTVTDEPGIYLDGRFGVRTENTMLVTPYLQTEFGQFLQLEPLTLCPIDTTPIERDLLSPDELQWLNDYHQHVFDILAPHLDSDDRAWLQEACKAL